VGLEFTEKGVAIRPGLPLASFRFDSPLVGVVKTARGYEGWYNPAVRNTWSVRLSLSSEEMKHLSRAEVNGMRVHPRADDGTIELRGEGGAASAMRWSVVRG
jgi:hypothetical protein